MKTNLNNRTLFLIFVLLFLVISQANATTMLKYSTADLTTKADNIVVGKTVKNKSEWNEDKTKIFTYTTIEVITHVKGVTETNTITIKEAGGIVNDVGMRVDGIAEYKTGEESVIFLTKHGQLYRTVGMMQGKYNIVLDQKSGKKRVHPSTSRKVMFVNGNGENILPLDKQGAKDSVLEAPTLDDFLLEIKSYLNK